MINGSLFSASMAECPATPPNLADCERLRTPSPSKPQQKSTVDGNMSHVNREINANKTGDKESGDSSVKDKIEDNPRSPEPGCAICLGQIENMSYTDSCFHKFCFTCLLEWSKVSSVCYSFVMYDI